MKILIWENLCTPVFSESLFAITKMWKQLKCPSITEWIKKMRYICTMRHCWSINENDVLPSVATWMCLEGSVWKWNVGERQILHDFSNIWNPKKEMNKQTKERRSHRFREVVSGSQRGEEQEVERNGRGRLRCRLPVTRPPRRGGEWAVPGQQSRSLLCDRAQLAWQWRPSRHAQKPWSPLLRTSS